MTNLLTNYLIFSWFIAVLSQFLMGFKFVVTSFQLTFRSFFIVTSIFAFSTLSVHTVSAAPNNTANKVKHISAPNKQANLLQMIGQMFMLGFNGVTAKDKGSQEVQKLISQGHIGGLIFMGHNMSSRKQITDLIKFMKLGASTSLPPLMAIDQEGGQVQRLKEQHGFTTIPTASSIALANDQINALQTYQTLAKELARAGFNVNFGPVVDLNLVPENPIIGARERSYGNTPEIVKTYSSAFVLAHRQNNILTSLKHFPGHGSSWTDSHEQFVDLTKSWKKSELAPYRQMVKANLVDMVMVGHLYHPFFSDSDKLPASLSRKAIEGVLRKDIGYQGLVITDDLGMGAIKKYFSFEDAIIKSISAGNDIILITDGKYATSSEITRLQKLIYSAVKRGDIKKSSIERSYQRIVKAKKLLIKQ